MDFYFVFLSTCTTFAPKTAKGMVIEQSTIEDFKAGRLESFYSKVFPSLLTYAARILGGDYAFLAEDCVQDCIYKMYVRRDTFDRPSYFKSYAYALVHNSAVSVVRKSRSQSDYVGQQDYIDGGFQLTMIHQETLDLLYSAIESLPPHLHDIFEMSFEQGMKNEEIAAALNVSTSTIKRRKAQMIAMLRDNLKENYIILLLLQLES